MVILGLIVLITVNAVTPVKVGSNRLYTILFATSLLFIPLDYLGNLELFNGYIAISPLTSSLLFLILFISSFTTYSITNIHVNGPILLLCSTGAILLTEANHLISLLLSIELQSFTAYLLVATSSNFMGNIQINEYENSNLNKTFNVNELSVSASMRYLILGATASSIILLAIGLLYTYTGVIDYNNLLLVNTNSLGGWNIEIIAYIMLFIGCAFKLGLAPLHQWTPDVYGNINNFTIAFVSIVPKIGILSFFNLLLSHTVPMSIIFFFTGLSIVIGSIGGLQQIEYRRLIAYSSITHMGYLALSATELCSDSTLLIYLLQYTITTIACLFTFNILDTQNNGLISSLKGSLHILPAASIILIALIFSLAGIPPLIGFFAKLDIFYALIASNSYFILLIAIITSGIGAFYYLRIIYLMLSEYSEYYQSNNTIAYTKLNNQYFLSAIFIAALFIFLEGNTLEQTIILFTSI